MGQRPKWEGNKQGITGQNAESEGSLCDYRHSWDGVKALRLSRWDVTKT